MGVSSIVSKPLDGKESIYKVIPAIAGVMLAVPQPGRPDSRPRGCKATGMSPPKRYTDVLERSPGMAVRLAGRASCRKPMRLSGLKPLLQGHPAVVRLAGNQPGRPDGRPRGCKATGMSPPKRYTDVLERSPGMAVRLAGRAFWRQTMRLSGLKPLLQAGTQRIQPAKTRPWAIPPGSRRRGGR